MSEIGENEFHQVMEIVNEESEETGVTCKKGDTIYREPDSDYPYRYIVLCNNGRDALEVRKEEGDPYWEVVRTIIWQGKKP